MTVWPHLSELRQRVHDLKKLEANLTAILESSLEVKATLVELADNDHGIAEIAMKLDEAGDILAEAGVSLLLVKGLRELAEEAYSALLAEGGLVQ